MKKKILAAIAAVSGLVALDPAAHAADGSINFTGSIVHTTCNINGAAAPTSSAVVLPPVTANELIKAGSTAGRTFFKIVLSGCSGEGRKVTAYFLPSNSVGSNGRLIVDSGGAKNVEIALLTQQTSSSSPIYVGAGVTPSTSSHFYYPIENGSTTMYYGAEYVSLGNVTAGAVLSRVEYNVVYQ